MDIVEGRFYHVKDDFFDAVISGGLMANKEGGHSRPHCLALRDDDEPRIIWMVPVSSKVDKYKALRDKMAKRYGKCTKIVIAKCGGMDAAYLIQNAFPTTARYIDHVHTYGEVPVEIHEGTRKLIAQCLRNNLRLQRRGAKLFFPDVSSIYQSMLDELQPNPGI